MDRNIKKWKLEFKLNYNPSQKNNFNYCTEINNVSLYIFLRGCHMGWPQPSKKATGEDDYRNLFILIFY